MFLCPPRLDTRWDPVQESQPKPCPDHISFLQGVRPVSPSSPEPAVTGSWVRRRPPCLTSTPCFGRNQGTCKLCVGEPSCIWPWTSFRCQPILWGWASRGEGEQGCCLPPLLKEGEHGQSFQSHRGACQNLVFSPEALRGTGATFPQIHHG